MADRDESEKPTAVTRCADLGGADFLRAMRMAFAPSAIFLVLAALVICFAWGTLLDWAWVKAGHGISGGDVAPSVTALLGDDGPDDAMDVGRGVFEVWWSRERAAFGGCLVSVRHLRFFGSPGGSDLLPQGAGQWMPPGALAGDSGLLGCIRMGMQAVVQMFTGNWLFAILFFGVSLLVCALAGGAVCRLHAVEYAKGTAIGLHDGLAFARDRYWSGFVMAPLMPLVFVVLLVLALGVGGMVLSIPWLGDLVGGAMFVLALAMGFLAALAIVMAVVGGSFYWPAVAATGCDAMDGVLNSSAYIRSRPGRSIWYLFVTLVLVCLTWVAVSAFVWLGLRVTNVCVGAGTDVWTSRDAVAGRLDLPEGSKLDAVWSMRGPGGLIGEAPYQLRAHDHVSRFLVGIWVRLAASVPLAAAVSVWLACSTVVFFLLRREVDNVEAEDIDLSGLESGETLAEPEPSEGESTSEPPPATPPEQG